MFWGTVRCGKLLAILDFQVVQGAGENAVGGATAVAFEGASVRGPVCVLCNAQENTRHFRADYIKGDTPLATRIRRSWLCCSPLTVELPQKCCASQ